MTELKTLEAQVEYLLEMGDNVGAVALVMLGIYRELRELRRMNQYAINKDAEQALSDDETDYQQTINDARPGG